MSIEDEALELYRELESLHSEALERGRGGDWEGAATHGERAAAVLARLTTLGPVETTDAAVRERLAATIRRTLALIGELQGLAGPARAESEGELASAVQRNKLNDRYGL